MGPSVNGEAGKALRALLVDLEAQLNSDVISFVGGIRPGGDSLIRAAIEALPTRRNKLAVVLNTGGGVVEVAERMVNVMRHFYAEVVFIVPNLAMSAGTVLAMSGDAIMMDFFACLGPIDPQLEREGKLIPALSYLAQWDRLVEKAQNKTLTDAEFLIMRGMDIAELHQFEMARDLSISLLKEWLTKYKFKDWTITEETQTPVTPAMREARAKEIATKLMKHDLWGSHGRAIPMKVLRKELNLRIDDFGENALLAGAIKNYFSLLADYIITNKLADSAHVHSREFI